MTVTACCLDTDFYCRQCVATVMFWPRREGTFVLCSLFMNLLLVFVNLKYDFAILSKSKVLLYIKRCTGVLHLSLYFITVFWLQKWQFYILYVKYICLKCTLLFVWVNSYIIVDLAEYWLIMSTNIVNYIKIICFTKVNAYFNKCKSFVFKCIIK